MTWHRQVNQGGSSVPGVIIKGVFSYDSVPPILFCTLAACLGVGEVEGVGEGPKLPKGGDGKH